MDIRLTGPLLVAGATLYLAAFAWAITAWDYDTWGVFVVLPPLAVTGVIGLRWLFRGELRAIGTIMMVGLFVKFAGAFARHWVGFEAYGGGIDAARYHDYAAPVATSVWSAEINPLRLIPRSTGTPFMEEVTAIIYTLTGVSLLGGFMVFAWIAYWGTALFVKAACIAVPGLVQRRYAVLVILAPSIVYWPSSIGKEAWMFLTLGLATYGIARLFARQGFIVPVVIALVGLFGAALLRPHMAGLWIAGALPALVVAVFAPVPGLRDRPRIADRAWMVVVAVVAAVALSAAVGATVQYLNFVDETGEVTATSILDETTRRTVQAGSQFDPPSIGNPATWPYASVRTLTRPLLIEARGAGPLLSALEMTVLLGIAAVSWRRIVNLPHQILTVPFVTFAMTVLFFGSLAFTSFANLGILTRQRTLLFPFLLLILVLPARRKPGDEELPSERSADPLDAAAAHGGVGTSEEWQPALVAAGADRGVSDGWGAPRRRPVEAEAIENPRLVHAEWQPSRTRDGNGGSRETPDRSVWEPSVRRDASDDGTVGAVYAPEQFSTRAAAWQTAVPRHPRSEPEQPIRPPSAWN